MRKVPLYSSTLPLHTTFLLIPCLEPHSSLLQTLQYKEHLERLNDESRFIVDYLFGGRNGWAGEGRSQVATLLNGVICAMMQSILVFHPKSHFPIEPKAPMAPTPIPRRARPGLWPTHTLLDGAVFVPDDPKTAPPPRTPQ